MSDRHCHLFTRRASIEYQKNVRYLLMNFITEYNIFVNTDSRKAADNRSRYTHMKGICCGECWTTFKKKHSLSMYKLWFCKLYALGSNSPQLSTHIINTYINYTYLTLYETCITIILPPQLFEEILI